MTGTLEGMWIAVHTRAGREQAARDYLKAHAYELFLPTQPATRRRRGTSLQPLFPGYLFCRYRLAWQHRIIEAPGVLGIVSAGRVPLAVDPDEVDAIKRVVESGVRTYHWPYLQAGERVRIRSGPLEGLTGIFVAHRSLRCVVVCVQLLMRSVAVALDRDDIVSVAV